MSSRGRGLGAAPGRRCNELKGSRPRRGPGRRCHQQAGARRKTRPPYRVPAAPSRRPKANEGERIWKQSTSWWKFPGAAGTSTNTTGRRDASCWTGRSEEHTSELQSRENLVCRPLLEKKKTRKRNLGAG